MRRWELGAGVRLAGSRRGLGVCLISCGRAGRSVRQARGHPAQWPGKHACFVFRSSVLVFLDAALSRPLCVLLWGLVSPDSFQYELS